MGRASVSRASTESAREHARIWLQDPENRKRAREIAARHLARSDGTSLARKRAMEAFGREIAKFAAGPRVSTCRICSDEFETGRKRGRPAIYCDKCVRVFNRGVKRCKGCGRTMPKGRQLTCRWCGRLWGRNRDGKI